jgi:diguanylate cyclase (GGDEF)-like protein
MAPQGLLQKFRRSIVGRTDSRLARLGIASYLAIALVAVVALVLAANFLVIRAASVEKTITIYQRVIEHAAAVVSPAPAVPPVVAPSIQRVDGIELQSAFQRYRSAVHSRVEAPSDATSAEQRDAADELRRVLDDFRARAGEINRRATAVKVAAALTSWVANSDELIVAADKSRESLQSYVEAADELDAHAKGSLNHAWKIFGLVITRQTLLQYNAALGDLRAAADNLKPDAVGDPDTTANLTALEERARKLLEASEAGFRRVLGADWYSTQHEGYLRLAQLRQGVTQQFEQLSAHIAANAAGADEASKAIPRHLQIVTPGNTLSIGSPAATDHATTSAPVQTIETEAPTTTESVVYHDGSGRHRQRIIGGVSAGVVLLLLLIGAGMFISIARPVRRLLRATTRIAKGEESVRIERGGIRELDRLAVAFNAMAEELTQARVISADYQRSLEEKVNERTQQLREQAESDYLTGLPNRRYFLSLLQEALEDAETMSQLVGVYFLDIDNFKYLNDSLGHAFGDRVLVGVAERLRETVAGFGKAARFGGDEFTVLLEAAHGADDIREAGQRIIDAFQRPLSIDGKDLIVAVSVGASIYPEHEKRADALLKAADAALYRAKRLGRGRLALFTSDLLEAAANTFSIEQGLRRAVERGEFELLFQPEVDAETLQPCLVEALMRWRLQDGRLISPGEFMAVAEESGLIIEICDWVLIKAVQAAARWHHGSWPDVRVAINIHPKQLMDPAFTARLQNLLTQFRLPARCIELELTESVLQTGPTTLAALRELQSIGIAIALDDFGTGYSSLSSLQKLPLSRVKLDQSLVADMDSNPRSEAMVRAIINMCQQLGLHITAEGVERAEQFAQLCEYRGLYLQGYLLSRPVAEADLQRTCEEVSQRAQELLLTVSGSIIARRRCGEAGTGAVMASTLDMRG